MLELHFSAARWSWGLASLASAQTHEPVVLAEFSKLGFPVVLTFCSACWRLEQVVEIGFFVEQTAIFSESYWALTACLD